jgi:hypothetical protein
MALCEIYRNNADVTGQLHVQNRPCQLQQIGSMNCGLFAIYNSLLLASGVMPESVVLSESELRAHLAFCLEQGKLDDFPLTTKSANRTRLGLLQLDVKQYLGQRAEKNSRKELRYLVCQPKPYLVN